jgi:chemotaxis protein CheX
MEGGLNLGPAAGRGPNGLSGLEPITCTLPQILDLTAAKPLHDSLAAMLGDHTIILDANAVERMSTPCAQVLLAAGRACSLGGSFRIVRASAVFQTAIADLGLQSEFSEWME